LSEYFLSHLSLCLIRAQLGRLPLVDANEVVVCHSFTLLNRTPRMLCGSCPAEAELSDRHFSTVRLAVDNQGPHGQAH
jgi:hypothetical protein